MEDSMSSTNLKNRFNFSGDGLEVSSEDSGWSSYFDNSIASSNVEDTVTCSGSENSSIFSGAAVSVKKMNMNNGDRVASARSVAKRRKMLATNIDPDLEDTAISPVCNSEAQDLEQLQIKLQETGGLNILPPVQQGKRDFFNFFQEKQNTSNQTGEVPQSGYIGKDISYAGLKEKGLCLVPVSLLFRVRSHYIEKEWFCHISVLYLKDADQLPYKNSISNSFSNSLWLEAGGCVHLGLPPPGPASPA